MRNFKTVFLSVLIGSTIFFAFQNCARTNDISSSDSSKSSSTSTPGSTPSPPSAVPSVACTKILTSGSQWTVPSDWNSSSNTIEAIGNGSDAGGNVRGGGGGGAYSKSVNVVLVPGSPVAYSVAHITISLSAGTDSGDSYLCNSTANCASMAGAAVVVGAQGGHGSTNGVNLDSVGGAGGSAAAGVAAGPGALKYSGGAGGNCGDVYCSLLIPGGGGGAAGPYGNGGDGSASGVGGAGDAGHGGGGAGSAAAGGAGAEFDASHGSGGGGGGGGSGSGIGGNYGGGAGGGAYGFYQNTTGSGGLIVIKYLGTSCN